MAFYIFPFLSDLPVWNTRGVIAALILHIGVSEPLYYWVHRCFHGNYLFTRYHSLHHASTVTQSFTGERNKNPSAHLISSSSHLTTHSRTVKFLVCLFNPFFILFTAAGSATFLEHLILSAVVGIPVLGSSLMGFGSISMIYGYVLIFDFLRCLGHSNVEVVPHAMFHAFPFLKYLIYTPT